MRMQHTVGIFAALGAALALAQTTSSAEPAVAATPDSNYIGHNERQPTDDLMTGRRRFEPGAHTAWHIHPAGQLILVEEGTGVVQRRGEPLRVLHKGETDFTPAGVPHWHGAAPGAPAVMAMVHFGGIGPWLDPVSDADYASATAALRESDKPSRPDTRGSAPVDSAGANYVGQTSTLPADDMQLARGRFDAGARTNWHVHPRGQVILAEQGTVYVQQRGGPVKKLEPGQSDFTPPGVPHWHGAGPDSAATKVVVGFGAPTQWLEPVGDAEYAAATREKRP